MEVRQLHETGAYDVNAAPLRIEARSRSVTRIKVGHLDIDVKTADLLDAVESESLNTLQARCSDADHSRSLESTACCRS